MEGNLVVNGILASCYASSDHDVAHNTMKPILWYPEIIKSIFGVYDGSPIFVTAAKELGKLLLPNDIP